MLGFVRRSGVAQVSGLRLDGVGPAARGSLGRS
jgi:hypothetical protein